MDDTPYIDIRFKPEAESTAILDEELALLESMLPDLIQAMIALEAAEAE